MTAAKPFNAPKKTPEDLGRVLMKALNKTTAQFNNERAVALIKAGANIHMKHSFYENRNALIMAAYWGHTECVRLLIEAGSKLDEQDRSGNTALMHAFFNNKPDCAQLLIAAGAKLDIQNNNGYTSLMQNVGISWREEYISALLEAGADMDLRNNAGHTALDIAKRNKLRPVIQILEEEVHRRVEKAAEEEKRAREEFLANTDFHKGLDKPMRAPKPIRPKPPAQ